MLVLLPYLTGLCLALLNFWEFQLKLDRLASRILLQPTSRILLQPTSPTKQQRTRRLACSLLQAVTTVLAVLTDTTTASRELRAAAFYLVLLKLCMWRRCNWRHDTLGLACSAAVSLLPGSGEEPAASLPLIELASELVTRLTVLYLPALLVTLWILLAPFLIVITIAAISLFLLFLLLRSESNLAKIVMCFLAPKLLVSVQETVNNPNLTTEYVMLSHIDYIDDARPINLSEINITSPDTFQSVESNIPVTMNHSLPTRPTAINTYTPVSAREYLIIKTEQTSRECHLSGILINSSPRLGFLSRLFFTLYTSLLRCISPHYLSLFGYTEFTMSLKSPNACRQVDQKIVFVNGQIIVKSQSTCPVIVTQVGYQCIL